MKREQWYRHEERRGTYTRGLALSDCSRGEISETQVTLMVRTMFKDSRK